MTPRLPVALLILACVLPAVASQNQPAVSKPRQSEPAGLDLLHRMQDALGGANRIAAVRDFEETAGTYAICAALVFLNTC